MNIDTLIPISYENVVNQILANLNSFSTDCLVEKSELESFIRNPENKDAVMSAYKLYGIPPANRPKKKRFPRKDIVYCDKFAPLQFLYAAKFKKTYPELESIPENCGKIKSLISVLDLERVNATSDITRDKTLGIGDAKLKILNEINTKYLSDFSKMDCPSYLDKVEQQDFNEQIKQQDIQSNKPNTATYFIYGVSGLIVLLSLGMLFKKK